MIVVLRLTVQAQADFDRIGAYTMDMWGEDQAVNYLTRLDQTFAALASTPALGKARDDLRQGLLSFPCNRHVIFFRRNRLGNVEILRILHERMDFERHL